MKRLHRKHPPAALANYRHGRHTWSDLIAADRAAIRAELDQMQSGHCAYCEGSLATLGCHIEHFAPKSTWPQGTFDWNNLLGSCDRADSCGHHKDSRAAPGYQIGDLIDPSVEDPDRYFVIRDSGRIEVRPTLGARDETRATKTLAVLNLNLDEGRGGRSLCAERRRVLAFYLQREPDVLAALASLDPEQCAQVIQDEVEIAAREPFGSIVRHFFQSHTQAV